MKKVIVLFALGFCLSASGQRYISNDTLNTGASDTVNYTVRDKPGNIMFGGSWSYHLDYRLADTTTATLGLYGSNFHPDSATYQLLWIDLNLDGSNDNPKTLSDTADADQSWNVWGEAFPYLYFIRELTRNGLSDSTKLYEKIIQQ